MRVDRHKKKVLNSSFLSCEKDAQLIIEKLFLEDPITGEDLKRLLVLNTKDCLDRNNENYNKIMKNTSIKSLIDGNYITFSPRVELSEHEEAKSYMIVSFDNFIETTNPEFRDCHVIFDVLCPTKYWSTGDFSVRPLKILGIIDAILNNSRLTGIGELHFFGASEHILNEDLAGYTIVYEATHGSDDRIPGTEIL